MSAVPVIRLREANPAPVRADGRYVLYWMTAYRRTRHNFALQRATEWCARLGKPVLVFEPLRVGYRHASDRLHRFVLDGMRDNARACAAADVRYYPYVEPEAGAGKGLLEALGAEAAVVVTDEFPASFHPRMVRAAARRLDVLLETVDSCGLLPLSATDRDYPTAYAFRRHLQKTLPDHLAQMPLANPLAPGRRCGTAVVPRDVLLRWPPASKALLEGDAPALAALPIDHDVPPVSYRGGASAAHRALHQFTGRCLARYGEDRNEPEVDATSGLSPYLHFGHVGSHDVFDAVAKQEGWSLDDLGPRADGKREGWWGLSESAEAFLDQLVTWRELGFNFCRHRDDTMTFDGLPEWARATLMKHVTDERPHIYDRKALEAGKTYDPLWNASMSQLRSEGRIHNYLRMLWGKKVLEWARDPTDALATLIHLNDRWAVDGRDPNSYSGIGWCLGRYDRPWGPEREIFGTVRYMSSVNTARKLHVGAYVRRWL